MKKLKLDKNKEQYTGVGAILIDPIAQCEYILICPDQGLLTNIGRRLNWSNRDVSMDRILIVTKGKQL